ncbi:MAG: DUF1851 domain-containing protein [Roseibium sp.]|nr:DUF1851 domain-containing protein [Roseibium sp.]
MFERFLSGFSEDKTQPAPNSLDESTGYPASGMEWFWKTIAGKSFNNGLYRTHTRRDAKRWSRLTTEAYPEYAGRVHCFAYDWLGRQFCLDFDRVEAGEPLILMLEPGTGEALEIPCNFLQFHNDELVNEADAALAAGFYDAWLAQGYQAPKSCQCVGYKHPLFLGGNDELPNLELTDLEVYWEIMSQLLCKIRGMAPGTPIGKITIE